jgi:hypothetical protein
MNKKKELTKTETEAITAARAKLRRDIVKWRSTQFDIFPKLRDHIPSVDFAKPEEDALLLPSSLSVDRRNQLGLTEVAPIEYKLREGQAHGALQKLRQSIKEFNANLAFKKINIHGQGPCTRAQAFLQSLCADKVNAADQYRRARAALLSLGLPKDDKVLQELRNDQLWMKNVSAPRTLGATNEGGDPWFWSAGRPAGLTKEEDDEWSQECKGFYCHVSSH